MRYFILEIVFFCGFLICACQKKHDFAVSAVQTKPSKDTFQIVYEKHPNGTLAKTGVKINNKPIGLWNTYDEDGKLDIQEVFFPNDSLSYFLGFWETGDTSSVGYSYNKKPIGFWKSYYANYHLAEEGNFDTKSEKEGIWKRYREDGSLQTVTEYKNGKGKVVWDDKKDPPPPY
jgi:antitoxin component YwqK of YwqJK toxin-antitoxin module